MLTLLFHQMSGGGTKIDFPLWNNYINQNQESRGWKIMLGWIGGENVMQGSLDRMEFP